MIALIRKHGRGCYMYTANLDTAHVQCKLHSCLLDWPFFAITFQGCHYTDTPIPFHLWREWSACSVHPRQCATSYTGVSGGLDSATQSTHHLSNLLSQLGLEKAVEKATPPTTKLDWIGVTSYSHGFPPEETLEEANQQLST